MNRFFVDPECWTDGQVHFDRPQCHQIRHVLRLRAGDEVEVLDNRGRLARVRLECVEAGRVTGRILELCPAVGEPELELTLYQALLPRQKFEWVLQKGTEVGVTTFVPVVTRRCLVQRAELKAPRRQRWEAIVTEAAEQCHRGRIPMIAEPVSLEESLAAAVDLWGLWASTGAQAQPLAAGITATDRRCGLWIGPEGGFDPEEERRARDRGLTFVSLGPRILRTETAAVVGAALVLHDWEVARAAGRPQPC